MSCKHKIANAVLRLSINHSHIENRFQYENHSYPVALLSIRFFSEEQINLPDCGQGDLEDNAAGDPERFSIGQIWRMVPIWTVQSGVE
jgi:hypothetical protein